MAKLSYFCLFYENSLYILLLVMILTHLEVLCFFTIGCFISFSISADPQMVDNNTKEIEDNIAVALERFNREFERMEKNFQQLQRQSNTISRFINNQRQLFRKQHILSDQCWVVPLSLRIYSLNNRYQYNRRTIDLTVDPILYNNWIYLLVFIMNMNLDCITVVNI